MSLRQRWSRLLMASVLFAGLTVAITVAQPPTVAQAATPPGFQEEVVFAGLNWPTNIEFSATTGQIFVAQKDGLIKIFDSLTDTTPTVFADLSSDTFGFWDRGLLGLALAPNFPVDPYVYALYTYDIGPDGAPLNDCAVGIVEECHAHARLVRMAANGNHAGPQQVLIEGWDQWCQEFPSHSIGDLQFGADGMLYLTSGDGASFNAVDTGDLPDAETCIDPPDEGGALRSQDVRTPADPTTLDGSLLRVNPATGAAAAGNPLTGADANRRRIVATGLRNPFRFTFRPGTNEVWIGDVGWRVWEEINRVANPTAQLTNFGWPCYEGMLPQPGYEAMNTPICDGLSRREHTRRRTSPTTTPPGWARRTLACRGPVLRRRPVWPSTPDPTRGHLPPAIQLTTTVRCSLAITDASASGS